MRSETQTKGAPSIGELRRYLARPRALGDLVDFAEALAPEAVRPTLYLLCSLHSTVNGSDDPAEARRWALFGALVTRYLFSVLELTGSRDLLI
jgi:hypothetical protein